MRRLGLGAIVAAIALGALAAGALALKTKSASTTIASGQDGSATAKCKQGTRAVAGGFESPDFLPPDSLDEPAVFTSESRREGRRKVVTSAHNSGPGEGTLVADAYCDKDKPRLKAKSASVAIDDLDDASLSVSCKLGSEAVWGGFVTDDLSLGSSREGKRTWTASAVVFGEPGTLTVFVYCDKSEPGLKAKSASTTIGSDEIGSATAKCKKRSEAVSGGYLAPGGFDLDDGSEIYFYESHRVGRRKWTASGLNQGDPATLTVFAYCEKKA